MTIPPLFRAAIAMESISPWTASPSIVRLPSSSAVVPRMTATSIGKAWKCSHSRPRSVTTSTRSSVVRRFCLPPVWRGSTYVPRPTCVISPGRPAAISRMSCESTPWGNEYASISFASTRAPSRGSLPMLLPIVRRMSPGRPSCEKPRSAKSPMPTTRTVVRSRGLPSSVYALASSSMKRWGRAWPAPDPPMTNVLPSRTSPTASRTSMTLVTSPAVRSRHVAASVGVERLPEEQAGRIGEQEYHRVGDLVRPPKSAQRHILQASGAFLAVDKVGRHLGDGDAGRDCVDPNPVRTELLRQCSRQPYEPCLGRAVGGRLRDADLAQPRRDVNDRPAAALDHRREGGAAGVKRSGQVRPGDALPFRGPDLRPRAD